MLTQPTPNAAQRGRSFEMMKEVFATSIPPTSPEHMSERHAAAIAPLSVA